MKPGDAEWYNNQPIVRAILEGVQKMASEIMHVSGRKGLMRVYLASDTGLSIGLVPGTCTTLHTAAGPVELYCERRLDVEFQREWLGQFKPKDAL